MTTKVATEAAGATPTAKTMRTGPVNVGQGAIGRAPMKAEYGATTIIRIGNKVLATETTAMGASIQTSPAMVGETSTPPVTKGEDMNERQAASATATVGAEKRAATSVVLGAKSSPTILTHEKTIAETSLDTDDKTMKTAITKIAGGTKNSDMAERLLTAATTVTAKVAGGQKDMMSVAMKAGAKRADTDARTKAGGTSTAEAMRAATQTRA